MEQVSNELLGGLLAALVINSLVLVLFRYWVRGHVLLNVVALYYWMQVGWLILSCLISGSSKLLLNTDLVLDLNEAPFRVPLGLTIMPLIALVCAAIIPGDARNLTGMHSVAKRRHRTMSFLLYIFALMPAYYYMATIVFGDSLFGSPFMYIYLSLFTTPVLLGVCRRRYRGPVVVFLCATLISALLAFGEGSRTLIFMTVVFFTAGVWLTVNFRRRVAILVIGLLLSLPVFYYSAMIEDVRTTIRNSTGETIMTRAAGIVELIVQQEASGNTMQEVLRGIDRMIMMSNLAVLAWTPEDIPYRGFGDMLNEIKHTNRTTLNEEGRDLAALQFDYEAGLGAANIYGFQASVGGAVPFPVLADGWSRAGLIGAAGFSLILCFMLGLAEYFVRRRYADKPYLILAFLAILGASSFERMSTYPLVYNLRFLIMQVILWSIVFYAISWWSASKSKSPSIVNVPESGLKFRVSRPSVRPSPKGAGRAEKTSGITRHRDC